MQDSQVQSMDEECRTPEESQARKWLWIAYWLYAAGILFGLCAIVAVIVDFIKSADLKRCGVLYASHLRWQVRTFWFTLLWAVIAAILSVVFIGVLLGAGVAIWYIYRVVKGMILLSDGKSMY